ncbi:MAG: hypothetical protein ACOCRK_11310, partial [bacterium]
MNIIPNTESTKSTYININYLKSSQVDVNIGKIEFTEKNSKEPAQTKEIKAYKNINLGDSKKEVNNKFEEDPEIDPITYKGKKITTEEYICYTTKITEDKVILIPTFYNDKLSKLYILGIEPDDFLDDINADTEEDLKINQIDEKYIDLFTQIVLKKYGFPDETNEYNSYDFALDSGESK